MFIQINSKSNQRGRFYKHRTEVEYVAAEVQIKYNNIIYMQ